MKTYVIDVRYYIPANDDEEFNEILDKSGIIDSEYYGGYCMVEVEEDGE